MCALPRGHEGLNALMHAHDWVCQRQRASLLQDGNQLVELGARVRASDHYPNGVKQFFALCSGGTGSGTAEIFSAKAAITASVFSAFSTSAFSVVAIAAVGSKLKMSAARVGNSSSLS